MTNITTSGGKSTVPVMHQIPASFCIDPDNEKILTCPRVSLEKGWGTFHLRISKLEKSPFECKMKRSFKAQNEIDIPMTIVAFLNIESSSFFKKVYHRWLLKF